MLNAQFSIPIRGEKWMLDCQGFRVMQEKIALSDQYEERLIEFAARIVDLAGLAARSYRGRHIANQIMRSRDRWSAKLCGGTWAESRADFIHKMRIVQKELNETSVWIRIMAKSSVVSPEFLVDILAENKELCRIATASIRTARANASSSPSAEN
jgi:four helix bundle protein